MTEPANNEDNVQKAKQTLSNLTQNTSRALSGLLPTNALQQLMTRKYTLPDKTVASQVLMYRQLLHTAAKPGLKLSRPYQGTAAQTAVKHMPWWEHGIEESRRMVISYDNLIVRLWLNGAILPFTDLLNDGETMIDEKGLPPVPHLYWVDRLGFQQPDPVTDFRSGGVLSLGMMVHMVESCPDIVRRFHRDTGDAAVLPFGLTCINVTDMMSKFLMLAKSVDRMDALLSQKPFWRMFADPNAILALQELSMTVLCDVVVELGRERKLPCEKKNANDNLHGEHCGNVTVFDFPIILEMTEKRVGDDLLGAGPKTVEELRSMAANLRIKYRTQLEEKEKRYQKQVEDKEKQAPAPAAPAAPATLSSTANVLQGAGSVAQGVFSKFKEAASPVTFYRKSSDSGDGEQPSSTFKVSLDGDEQTQAAASAPDLLSAASSSDSPMMKEAGWANVSDGTTDVTTAVGEFCIGDVDDDDDDL